MNLEFFAYETIGAAVVNVKSVMNIPINDQYSIQADWDTWNKVEDLTRHPKIPGLDPRNHWEVCWLAALVELGLADDSSWRACGRIIPISGAHIRTA